MGMSLYYRCFFLAVVFFFFSVASVGALVDHAPVVINGDSGFAGGGFPGSGTVDDPYRIEGYRIVTDSLHRNGVEVHDTSVYFLVFGCVIDADYIGVLVDGAALGTVRIEDNVITGKSGDGGGVSLSCDGVVVLNNTCTGFVAGLHTNYCDGCEITYNNFSLNIYHGINLRYSSDNLVAHNVVSGNGAHGVFIIRDSAGNLIYDNTVYGNSVMDSYTWDNIYSFTVTSQGLDEDAGNSWYFEETGNKWGDYSGSGDYVIDGGAGSVDKYPVMASFEPIEVPSESSNGVPGFGFVSLVCGILLVCFLRDV